MNNIKTLTNIPDFMNKPIRDISYVVLDLETTGFKPETAGVTEVAMIIMKNGREEIFETFVNPGMAIPEKITELTGITDQMVMGQPSFKEVLGSIDVMFQDSVFVSHNVPFDWSFFAHGYKKYLGRELQMPSLCTLNLSRKMLGLKANKLENVAQHFGVELVNAHRAINDTKALGAILKGFFDIFEEKGILTGADLYKHNLIYPVRPPAR